MVFYCDKCKKGIRDKSDYVEHMRAHQGLKYHCDYCSKPFLSRKGLTYHLSQYIPGSIDLHVICVVKGSMTNRFLTNIYKSTIRPPKMGTIMKILKIYMVNFKDFIVYEYLFNYLPRLFVHL